MSGLQNLHIEITSTWSCGELKQVLKPLEVLHIKGRFEVVCPWSEDLRFYNSKNLPLYVPFQTEAEDPDHDGYFFMTPSASAFTEKHDADSHLVCS